MERTLVTALHGPELMVGVAFAKLGILITRGMTRFSNNRGLWIKLECQKIVGFAYCAEQQGWSGSWETWDAEQLS